MIEESIKNGIEKDKTIVGDFFEYDFRDKKFDCVILKSSMHEIPIEKMTEMHKKIKNVLRVDGVFIDWDVHQKTKEAALFLKKIVNKKDELAELSDLLQNRYFYTSYEIIESLEKAGFSGVNIFYDFYYHISVDKFAEMYFPKDENKKEIFKNYVNGILSEKPEDCIAGDVSKLELSFPAVMICAIN